MGFLTVLFYIVLTIWILGLLGKLAFRYIIYRAQKNMQQGGGGAFYRSYTWGGTREQKQEATKEGEVKIKTPPVDQSKKISKDVGDYVDYEEIK